MVAGTSRWADARVSSPLAGAPFPPTQHVPLGTADPADRTTPQLVRDLVRRAVADGGPLRAVVADRFAGATDGVRTGLYQAGGGSVVARTPSHAWWTPAGTVPALGAAARMATREGPDRRGPVRR